MPTRHQKEYVYRKKNRWYVRYYDYSLQKDGSIKRVQMARSIASVCHEFRTKRAVIPLVSEVLAEVNSNHLSPEGALSLERLMEESYLPYVSRQKRPSTFTGYRNM